MRELTYLKKDQLATTSQYIYIYIYIYLHHAGKRQEAYPSMKHHV
jgi:hypothetical protein